MPAASAERFDPMVDLLVIEYSYVISVVQKDRISICRHRKNNKTNSLKNIVPMGGFNCDMYPPEAGWVSPSVLASFELRTAVLKSRTVSLASELAMLRRDMV